MQPGGYFVYVAQIPEAASFNVYLQPEGQLHR